MQGRTALCAAQGNSNNQAPNYKQIPITKTESEIEKWFGHEEINFLNLFVFWDLGYVIFSRCARGGVPLEPASNQGPR